MRKLNKFLFILLTAILPLSLVGAVFLALSDVYHNNLNWAKIELWIGAGIGIAIWSLWIARLITGLTIFKENDNEDKNK